MLFPLEPTEARSAAVCFPDFCHEDLACFDHKKIQVGSSRGAHSHPQALEVRQADKDVWARLDCKTGSHLKRKKQNEKRFESPAVKRREGERSRQRRSRVAESPNSGGRCSQRAPGGPALSSCSKSALTLLSALGRPPELDAQTIFTKCKVLVIGAAARGLSG